MRRRDLLKGLFAVPAAAAAAKLGIARAAEAGRGANAAAHQYSGPVDISKWDKVDISKWDTSNINTNFREMMDERSPTNLTFDLPKADKVKSITGLEKRTPPIDKNGVPTDIKWPNRTFPAGLAEDIQRGKEKRWAKEDVGDYDQIDPDWRGHPNYAKLYERLERSRAGWNQQSPEKLAAKVQEARESSIMARQTERALLQKMSLKS